MTPFEEELKRALARHEPSGDFTSRVLAETSAQHPRSQVRTRSVSTKRWMIFGIDTRRFVMLAALLTVVLAGLAYRQHLRAVKGEAAKQQLVAAMRVAGVRLHQAQARIRRIEIPEVVMQ